MRCVVFLLGCWGVGGLEHSSLQNLRRSEVAAELGDGETAARAANQSVSDHEAAKRQAVAGSTYWDSEIRMQ